MHHRWLILASLALSACATAVESTEPATTSEPLLSAEQLKQTLIVMTLPSEETYGGRESLIQTQTGFAAFHRKGLGSGKEAAGWENRVFTSNDGVRWDEHLVPTPPTWVDYCTLAFGRGHYFLAGESGNSQTGAFMISDDGASWREQQASLPGILYATFVNGRFFALGELQGIFSSSDLHTWSGTPTSDAVQLNSMAYGDGTYLVGGSGPILASRDGSTWTAHTLPCELPDACVTRPDGIAVQGYRTNVLFGNHRFYSTHFYTDDAASTWHAESDERRVPDIFAGGYFLALHLNPGSMTLNAWQSDTSELIVTNVTNQYPSQLDCQTRRCLVFPHALILIP
jgi:hypothetical protein